MTDKQQAATAAARAVIAHGGPECRTDPHGVLDAIGAAYDAGATSDDVMAEMRRLRDSH